MVSEMRDGLRLRLLLAMMVAGAVALGLAEPSHSAALESGVRL